MVIKRGTNAADTLTGTASADTLYGLAGNGSWSNEDTFISRFDLNGDNTLSRLDGTAGSAATGESLARVPNDASGTVGRKR